MLNDITFGQYYAKDSFIHRMDARIKLLLLVFLIVLIFIAGNFLSLGLSAAFLISIMLASKVPLRLYIKNIKVIIPIVIFTALLNVIYTKTGVALVSFWSFTIWSDGLIKAAFMALRVLLLILISSVLTYTTTPNDLTDAIERLLKPLSFIGLGEPVHIMSMMMTIALRFIPTLIEETDKIMNAQKARGSDIDSGGIIKKIKALLPIIIPLLLSSVRRALELAEAMESRCYNGGKGRRRMKQMHMASRDYFALALSLAVFVSVILINIYF